MQVKIVLGNFRQIYLYTILNCNIYINQSPLKLKLHIIYLLGTNNYFK